jgi:hypothetical protein
LYNKTIDMGTYVEKVISTMKAYRAFLAGSYLEYGAVLIIFVLLAIIFTNFIAFNISSQLFVDGASDATAGFLWLNFADPGLNPVLSRTDLVNYPFGEQLGGATFITYAALWLPLRIFSFLFGPVAGLNIMMLWGFVSGAVGGYWLVKRLTGSIMIALFAGFAIAFVPYNIYKSSAHLAYIFSIVFIFILAAFAAVWARPTKKRAILLGASIALAFYTDGYYLLLATVMIAGLLMSGLLHGLLSRFKWQDYKSRIIALLMSFGCLIILMIPIIFTQVTHGSEIKETLSGARSNIEQEIIAYRSNVIDFIIPSSTNPFFVATGDADTIDNYKNRRSNSSESINYIGFVNTALLMAGLALLGLLLVMKRKSSLPLLRKSHLSNYLFFGCTIVVLVPLFLSFMFSPEVVVFGHTIHLPGRFLIDHDIALWRVMSRFFVPLHVIIVVFAAYSLWILVETSDFLRKRLSVRVAIIAILIIITSMEYSTAVYRPSFDFRSNVASGYHWLRDQKDIHAIAELPITDPLDYRSTQYITAQIVHGKKIINLRDPGVTRLTNTIGSIDNPETIDLAYKRGVQAIVTHGSECVSVAWGKLIHRSSESIAPARVMCIYKLEHSASGDGLFINFSTGFKYVVNSLRPNQSTAVLESRSATLRITDSSFQRYVSGRARITTEIADMHNDRVNGEWQLLQQGHIIAGGDIKNSTAQIDAIVDASQAIEVKTIPSRGSLLRPNDLSMIKTVVTAL